MHSDSQIEHTHTNTHKDCHSLLTNSLMHVTFDLNSSSATSVWSTEIAQAVTTSDAPTMHQLRLSPGQLIVVLAKNSSGWWLGELQVSH